MQLQFASGKAGWAGTRRTSEGSQIGHLWQRRRGSQDKVPQGGPGAVCGGRTAKLALLCLAWVGPPFSEADEDGCRLRSEYTGTRQTGPDAAKRTVQASMVADRLIREIGNGHLARLPISGCLLRRTPPAIGRSGFSLPHNRPS